MTRGRVKGCKFDGKICFNCGMIHKNLTGKNKSKSINKIK